MFSELSLLWSDSYISCMRHHLVVSSTYRLTCFHQHCSVSSTRLHSPSPSLLPLPLPPILPDHTSPISALVFLSIKSPHLHSEGICSTRFILHVHPTLPNFPQLFHPINPSTLPLSPLVTPSPSTPPLFPCPLWSLLHPQPLHSSPVLSSHSFTLNPSTLSLSSLVTPSPSTPPLFPCPL